MSITLFLLIPSHRYYKYVLHEDMSILINDDHTKDNSLYIYIYCFHQFWLPQVGNHPRCLHVKKTIIIVGQGISINIINLLWNIQNPSDT